MTMTHKPQKWQRMEDHRELVQTIITAVAVFE